MSVQTRDHDASLVEPPKDGRATRATKERVCAERPRSRRARRPLTRAGVLADFVIAGCLALVSVVIGVIGATHSDSLSMIDEVTHLDYVWQVQHGNIPARGDHIAPEILRDYACRDRTPIPLADRPACGSPESADPERFGLSKGVNYNDFHPPLYYATNAAISSMIQNATGATFITAARLANAVIFSVGVACVYFAIRNWAVSRSASAASTLILLASPSFIFPATVVTNDAVNIWAGVGLIFLAERVFSAKRFPFISAPLIVAAICASKAISAVGFVALGFVLGFLGVFYLLKRDLRGVFRSVSTAVLMALPLISVTYLWNRFQGGRGNPGAETPVAGVNTVPVSGSPFDDVITTLFDTFRYGALGQDWYPTELNGWYVEFLSSLTSALFAGLAVAGLFAFKRHSPELRVARVLLAGLVITPVFVQIQSFLSVGLMFPSISTRYVMCLIPLSALVFGLLIDRRRQGAWVLLPAAALASLMLFGVLGISGLKQM